MFEPVTCRGGLVAFCDLACVSLAFTLSAGLAPAAFGSGPCTSHWDTAIGNPGFDGSVIAMVPLPGGDLIAAGNFTSAGGEAANRIARWDGSAWHPLGDGIADGTIYAMAVLPDGDLIAGGSFTMAGDIAASNIARWDGFAWHPLDIGMDGVVRALHVLPDGDLIAGGLFVTAGGVTVNRIARWDGAAWHALGSGVNQIVYALASIDGLLYVGGEFTEAGSVEANRIARWDGSQWQPIAGGFDGPVRTITVLDENDSVSLIVTGLFASSDGVPLFNRSAKWDGSHWVPMGPLASSISPTAATAGTDGSLVYSVTSSPSDIVSWDGLWWKPMGADINGIIGSLLVHEDSIGSGLVVAGNFTSVDGAPASSIAIWRDCPSTPPVTHHVPNDFASIQSAIDAADDGDVVMVAPGTYNEAINFSGKTITLQSEAGAEMTIVDASGFDVPAVFIGEGTQPGTVLRGFTVTGATSAAGGTGVYVHDAAVWIDQCVITGNGGPDSVGGGLVVWVADVLVTDCTIQGNQATYGGGVLLSGNRSARFVDCLLVENVAIYGGAVNANSGSHSSYFHCEFRANATNYPWGSGTAGVSVGAVSGIPSSGLFVDCVFVENVSESGPGGFSATNADVVLRNCLFERNHTWVNGGGARLGTGTTLYNCSFVDNYARRGAGAHIFSDATLFDCSFIENNAGEFGGGAYISSGATLVDCSFIDNSAEEGGGVFSFDFDVTLLRASFMGNSAVTGGAMFGRRFNVDDSTFLANTATKAGAVYSVATAQLDLPKVANSDFSDNEPDDNIVGLYEDLGGNTFCGVFGDLNGDGVVDLADLLILLAAWGDCPAKGECPADLNDDGVVDASDLLILLSAWS